MSDVTKKHQAPPPPAKAAGNAGATTTSSKPDPRVEDPNEGEASDRPEQAEADEIAPDAIPDKPAPQRS